MKRLKFIQSVFVAVIIVCMSSCEKFSLLKDAKTEHNPAGYQLLDKTMWEYLSENNFHENDSTNIGLYGRAVEQAGLRSLFDDNNVNLTVIIPQNASLKTFINNLGYSNIGDVPPIVLKNFLLNTIIDTRVRSFDLNIGQTNSYPSLSGDSLYLRRTASSSDEYILTVNASQTSNSQSTGVRSQNLEFKNGVAHVVKMVTHYIASTSFPDKPDESAVGYLTDTLYVSKDTYLGNGARKSTNFGSEDMITSKLANETGVNISYAKKMLVQLPVKAPTYAGGRIGSVKLEVYINKIEVSSRDSYVNFYECNNDDFNEMAVNWGNAPAFGSVPIGGLDAKGKLNTWQKVDISSHYISYLEQGKTFINIGAYTVADNGISFRSKEFNNGKFKSRIIMYNPGISILSPENINTVEVPLNSKVKVLTLDDLRFKGTDDKNISYAVTTLPQKGFLVINSLPATVNTSFTQEQIRKGVVKYLYNDDIAAADAFSLEARDFQGGIYDQIINMAVAIK
ncbi:DUF7594 domain-containing protein [Pseudopedobacter beijingensis]|uniref:DNRLRE domain-containing protein n=1 Tax=Pseudopedobacter beijingensis TaxID=1207056 RepID=A0ABW4IHF5_9SPHI